MRAMTTLIAAGLALGASMVYAGEGGRGEFGEQCAYGLSQGQRVQTDCSINFVTDRGTMLCFMDQKSAIKFMTNFAQKLKKARAA